MKLSIITINKNNAAGLRKTIESVVCQTFKNFFIVVATRDYCDEISNICREHGLKEGRDFCVPFKSITSR